MDTTKGPSQSYVAILALVSLLILGLGWLARPREIPESPPPIPSENELAQLARRTERRSLENMTRYFATTAAEVEASLVQVPRSGTSGIAWSGEVVVTAPLLHGAAEGLNGALNSGVEPAAWGPHLPLAAVERPQGLPALVPVRRANSLPRPGDWILAVWRTAQDRAFSPGTFLQSAPLTCGATTSSGSRVEPVLEPHHGRRRTV